MAIATKQNLMGASNQWASRPNDERFWGLADMGRHLNDSANRSREVDLEVSRVKAYALDNDTLALRGSKGMVINPTHWGMGQLSTYADAPASYLRTLPAPLAADCINTGLQRYHGDNVQLLMEKQGDSDNVSLRAMTTKYSRLWNKDIVSALNPATDRGWMVPPARPVRDDPRSRVATAADIVPGQDCFGLAVKVGDQIAPAGCYASDRDMFIFMVNPNRTIDVDGSGNLMRGVFIWNSEVGAGAFKVQAFYLEAVCGNHIVWGASGVQTLRIVHKGNNFRNIGHKLGRELSALADKDTTNERTMIQRARSYTLGKDKEETVKAVHAIKGLGLSQKVIDVTYEVAETWEHTAKAAPVTAWGFAHGLTRYSQTVPYADERSKLDVAAGKILQLAYTAKG